MKHDICWQTLGPVVAIAVGGCLLTGCSMFFGDHEKHAEAQLVPTAGSQTRGFVTFVERADGVQVNYDINGLPPNSDHGFLIHERGDCAAADASSAGDVFSPVVGKRRVRARTEGDLANIRADSNGVATGFVVAPELSLDGIRSVLGRSVVVHRDSEDFYAPPDKSNGPALACGVIRP